MSGGVAYPPVMHVRGCGMLGGVAYPLGKFCDVSLGLWGQRFKGQSSHVGGAQ